MFRSELAEESDMYFGVMIRNNVSKVKQINKEDAQQFLKVNLYLLDPSYLNVSQVLDNKHFYS